MLQHVDLPTLGIQNHAIQNHTPSSQHSNYRVYHLYHSTQTLLVHYDFRCFLLRLIGLNHDVWIAAIASARTSLVTQTAAICVSFQGRRVRHAYVTIKVTFLTRKSALIYTSESRQPHSRLQWRFRDKGL